MNTQLHMSCQQANFTNAKYVRKGVCVCVCVCISVRTPGVLRGLNIIFDMALARTCEPYLYLYVGVSGLKKEERMSETSLRDQNLGGEGVKLLLKFLGPQ